MIQFKMDKSPKETFPKIRHTNGQQVHERCTAPPSIRKIQITTTMRYHFILVKMAITKRQKVSVGRIQKRNHLFTIGRMCGTTMSENSMMPSQRTKNRITMCSISLGLGTSEKKVISQQGICTPCSLQCYSQKYSQDVET